MMLLKECEKGLFSQKKLVTESNNAKKHNTCLKFMRTSKNLQKREKPE